MTDTIRTLLLNSGELEDNIMIDPQINTTSIKLDDGETFYGWVPKQSYVGIELDLQIRHMETHRLKLINITLLLKI